MAIFLHMDERRRIQRKKPSPQRQDASGKSFIDYSLERPFGDWADADIFRYLKTALSLQPMNLEISTLIVNELKVRDGDVKRARMEIKQSGGQEIFWHNGVHYRVQSLRDQFEPSSKYPKNCKVYFILLTKDRETPVPWGMYIGQTSKKIEKRFSVHLDENDNLGSRIVRRRGWQLLYGLCNLIPAMTYKDSCRFEGLLLDAFKGESNMKPIRKLPANRVKGAGPPEYRIKNQSIGVH